MTHNPDRFYSHPRTSEAKKGFLMYWQFICIIYLARNGDNPELYEAMKEENIVREFGPDAVADAPIYDEDTGHIIGDAGTDLYFSDDGMKHIISADGMEHMPPTDPVQFYLYSSLNPEKEQQIYFSETSRSMFNKGFNKTAPTKIICHGFMSNYKQGPGSLLRSAYFKAYKHANVILINWSSLAGVHRAAHPKTNFMATLSNIFYFPPARNTEIVGNHTASLIYLLVNSFGVSLSNIHLVGHSLGAHAMGFAGLAVQRDLKEKVGRITGLDPAGPCFESMYYLCFWQKYRAIMNTDAQFVDIIHTHTKVFGMKGAVGHVDFHPNGGRDQPECSSMSLGMCSHRRAIDQMADSVLFGRIIPGRNYLEAKKCSSWDDYKTGLCASSTTSQLGEFCSLLSNGKHYLRIKPLNTLERGFLLGAAGMSAFMLASRRAEMITRTFDSKKAIY